ncbi:MAG: hypothetical protein ACE5MH_09875 [Terriglobia bacterium]
MRTKILLFLLVLFVGGSAYAGDFWKEKDYRRWSKKECEKLLKNSPWAKRWIESRVLRQELSRPTGPEMQAKPEIVYEVQLRSALPIRQALVQMAQINQKYDEMPPEDQRDLDQQAEKFLAKRFPNRVVLHVAYSANLGLDDRELARYWRKQTTDTLRNFIFLIGGKGKKVPLLRYIAGEGQRREFQLVFPRHHEGRPLLGPGDKSLALEFPHPRIGVLGERRAFIEFKVKKMLVDGRVVY